MNTLNDNRLTRRRTIFIVGTVFLAAWSGLTPTSRADTVTVKTEDELKQAIAQYGSVKDNRRLGKAYALPKKDQKMLGFVPQPNLRKIGLLALTEPY